MILRTSFVLAVPAHSLCSLVMALCIVLLTAFAPSAHACQPPRPGERMPTGSEARQRFKEEADSIFVARGIRHGDNGKANPTAFEGKGWSTVRVLHTLKGTAREQVRYNLGGCGYGGSWNTHVPTDRDTLLFVKGDFVMYGVELPAGRISRRQAEEALHGGGNVPMPR